MRMMMLQPAGRLGGLVLAGPAKPIGFALGLRIADRQTGFACGLGRREPPAKVVDAPI
jgi:hypothetical protein